jgi:MOSC domain-containing protein YiiM
MDGHQQEAGQQLSLRGTVAAVSRNGVYSFTKPVRDEIVLVAGLGVAGDVHAGVTVRHRSRVAADPDQPNLRQVHLIHSELHEELVGAGYQVPAGGLGENVTTTGIDLLGLPVGTVLRFGPRPTAEHAPTPGFVAGPPPEAEATPVPGSAVNPLPEVEHAPMPDSAAEPSPGAADPSPGAAAVVAAARRANLDDPSAEAVAALAARLDAAEVPGDPRPAVFITGLRNPCQQINGYRSGLLKRVLGRNADGSLSRRAGVMGVVLRGGPIRPGTEIDVELPALPHRPLDRV